MHEMNFYGNRFHPPSSVTIDWSLQCLINNNGSHWFLAHINTSMNCRLYSYNERSSDHRHQRNGTMIHNLPHSYPRMCDAMVNGGLTHKMMRETNQRNWLMPIIFSLTMTNTGVNWIRTEKTEDTPHTHKHAVTAIRGKPLPIWIQQIEIYCVVVGCRQTKPLLCRRWPQHTHTRQSKWCLCLSYYVCLCVRACWMNTPTDYALLIWLGFDFRNVCELHGCECRKSYQNMPLIVLNVN